MIRKRRLVIERRKRFFLGCEGESERAYGSLIQRISDEENLHVFLDMVILKGGSPRSIVEQAVRYAGIRSSTHGPYFGKAVILDSDKLAESPNGTLGDLETLARSRKMLLVWQRPCHEAFLLRHLEGCESMDPADSREAMKMLRKRWHQYARPMQVSDLNERIGNRDLLRAARVEGSLKDFLEMLGLSTSP